MVIICEITAFLIAIFPIFSQTKETFCFTFAFGMIPIATIGSDTRILVLDSATTTRNTNGFVQKVQSTRARTHQSKSENVFRGTGQSGSSEKGNENEINAHVETVEKNLMRRILLLKGVPGTAPRMIVGPNGER
jgi:hypothetical protein